MTKTHTASVQPSQAMTAERPTPTKCPDPVALRFLQNQIAYERTGGADLLRGLPEIDAYVWQRGSLTAFYVRNKLPQAIPGIRTAYVFGDSGLVGGGTCAAKRNWKDCIESIAPRESAKSVVETCAVTLDLRKIPRWRPSPNNATKRRIARQLRHQIEAKWPGAQEIVLRDFNLEDPVIFMFLKMPDGDYYQSCGFHLQDEQHCDENWATFGSSPISDVKKWIFAEPYRLK